MRHKKRPIHDNSLAYCDYSHGLKRSNLLVTVIVFEQNCDMRDVLREILERLMSGDWELVAG